MLSIEKIRSRIINALLYKPILGENYINWYTKKSDECGVTIMYRNKEEQVDIIIKQSKEV